MKKILLLIGICTCFAFTSCGKHHKNVDASIYFDISNAKVLGTGKTPENVSADESVSRAVAREAESDSTLLKLLEDGSISEVINFGESFDSVSLSEVIVTGVMQSPLETSKDIFVMLKEGSDLYYEDSDGEQQSVHLSQIIVIHEDGTYDNVFDEKNTSDMGFFDAAKFDSNGNLYYDFQKKINGDWQAAIVKYDPSTKQNTAMTAYSKEIAYEGFELSNDGNWIIARGTGMGGEKNYLRAIPVDDPDGYEDLYYSSDVNNPCWGWAFDAENMIVYYVGQGKGYAEDDAETEEINESEIPIVHLFKIPMVDGTFTMDNKTALNTKGEEINIDGNTMVTTSTGLWGYDSNGYFCHFADKDGNLLSVEPVEGFADRMISGISAEGDYIYLRNSIINSAREETGKQTLLRYDTNSETIEDLFQNVPDNKKLELTSFCANSNEIYYSVVKGTKNIVGRINLATLENTQLSDSTSFSSIVILR